MVPRDLKEILVRNVKQLNYLAWRRGDTLMEEVQFAVSKACDRFVGALPTATTINNMEYAACTAVKEVYHRNDASLATVPKVVIEKCNSASNELHIVIAPHNFTGQRHYSCGCNFDFIDGHMRPWPPKNEIVWE